MEKPYKVLVNNLQEFSIGEKSIQELDALPQGEKTCHLLYHNESFPAEVLEEDFVNRTYTIRINSNTYEVKIGTPLDDLIKKMGYSAGSSKALNSVRAPMPGIIIDLNVKKGQEVKKGASLLILEAMKMENAILCPKDAKIKDIFVSKDDTVDKNKLLITLE
jgi:biotin carboxyl carrier protein